LSLLLRHSVTLVGSGSASPWNCLDNLRNNGKICKTALKHPPVRKNILSKIKNARPAGCYFFLILILRP
jgi:hypothetical protein